MRIFTTLLQTCYLASLILLSSCGDRHETGTKEQIIANPLEEKVEANDSSFNSITGNQTMKQLSTYPSKVILTGLKDHRLVSIYKSSTIRGNQTKGILSRSSSYYEGGENDMLTHFMPGIDILYGYNLVNIAHYDLKTEQSNFLFKHPVLVKTLYYPSFVQDSIEKQPINRDFYLISVYDEDTNKDTLINNRDLRRFYSFDATTRIRTQLIPSDYSVIRSQYDSKNDLMYIFARLDENKNGSEEPSEAVHVFWISLKVPAKAKLLY